MRQPVILLGLVPVLGSIAFLLTIHGFLAVSRPVDGDILVVEAWIWHSSALKEASDEFNRGRYNWLVIVGEPDGADRRSPTQKPSPELAAEHLRQLGVDEHRMIVLQVPDVTWHRTYASALTLRTWLTRSKTKTTGVNVFTLGAHARKSLVLFRRALGPGTRVGVIAGTDDTFNARHWWTSARGIYATLRKTLGYLYAIVWPLPQVLPVVSP